MGPSSSLLDPIPTRTLKILAPSVADSILQLVNCSLAIGWVPSHWKKAVITPLLKKPGFDQSDKKNFRPVSQLTILARITEHFVTAQLQHHCEAQGVLHDLQSGFRPGRGTETAILDIRERIAELQDLARPAALILLDLSAAFDTIDHEILLLRLEKVAGLRDLALGWCRSFLTGRSHQVHVEGQWSKPRPLRCGVPQGSALSPLLFNIYMAPLAILIESFGLGFQMYAEDTQLDVALSQEAHMGSNLIACLEGVKQWMNTSWLRLNETKTELLMFCPPSIGAVPSIPWPDSFGTRPAPVEVAKSLGVWFHQSGKASAHVSSVAKSSHWQLNRLSPVLPLLAPHYRAILCQALVLSKLQYCCTFFTGLTSSDLHRLQLVQNRAVRAVVGLRKYDHVSEARLKLGWLSVQDLVKVRGLCLIWKALHQQGPLYLQRRFQWEVRFNPTRSQLAGRASAPSFRRARALGVCLSRQGPRWWNELPRDIRLLQSFALFKSAVKAHLRWRDQG